MSDFEEEFGDKDETLRKWETPVLGRSAVSERTESGPLLRPSVENVVYSPS
jgi:hypothetical protein